jgi:hypothetical protein
VQARKKPAEEGNATSSLPITRSHKTEDRALPNNRHENLRSQDSSKLFHVHEKSTCVLEDEWCASNDQSHIYSANGSTLHCDFKFT